MRKSEVYSWRVSAETKEALESRARAEGTSMAELLDGIVVNWLEQQAADEDAAVQRRLHAAATKTIGTIRGGDRHLAEQAGARVKEILRKKYGR
jgi:hypothetical protein